MINKHFKILQLAIFLILFAVVPKLLGQTEITKISENTVNEKAAAELKLLLAETDKSPKHLFLISQKYDELKDFEKRDYYEKLIIEKYSDTAEAESVLYNQIQRIDKIVENIDKKPLTEQIKKIKSDNNSAESDILKNELMKNASVQNILKYIELRVAFINRSHHFDLEKLGNIFVEVLDISSVIPDINDESLQNLIDGALQYSKDKTINVNSKIAQALTEGKKTRPNSKLNNDVEKYLRDAVTEAEEKLKIIPKNVLSGSLIVTQCKAINNYGFFLMNKNQLDEAEKELLKVQKFVPDNFQQSSLLTDLIFTNNLYLSDLYEAKNDYDKMEEYYLKTAINFSRSSYFFKELYKKRHNGNSDGVDAYLKEIDGKINLKFKNELINSRIKEPKDAIPFSLKTIDGKVISFNDLKGKVIVINFWGTWCGPCVAELPEFERLYQKYINDNNVAVLTINSEDELETVKKFMNDKKYDFPVMLDENYIAKTPQFEDESCYPTTIFIGKQGKVEFVKKSLSPKLFEEFSWRIEELKKDK